jgi:hypothetical protein
MGCAQGLDYFLVMGTESPLKVKTSLFVPSMTVEELKDIAGENMAQETSDRI